MSGPIVLLYKGGERATGAPDCFTFCRDRTRGLRRPGFGTAWHVSELGEGCNTSLCRAMYRKVIPSVCQLFARVYANPTPSSGSLERSGDPRRRQGAKAMLVVLFRSCSIYKASSWRRAGRWTYGGGY